MLNRLRAGFTSVLPPLGRRVTGQETLPLVLFLVLFASVCLWLELSHRLLFTRPAAFGILALAPWVWWMSVAGGAALSRGRALTALLVRLSLLGLFVIVLAEPRAVRERDVLSVVYALDVSESVGEKAVDAAVEFVVKNVSGKPQKDEAGLIVFGRNAAVELPPRLSFPLEALNALVDRDATSLEQPLALASALLPEENAGRIVLISDGVQTEGSFTRSLDDLKSRGVAVDVLPLQYAYDREVWLERIDLPQQVKVGESYEVSVVLSSLLVGKGKLVLRENQEVVAEQDVKFTAGKNRFTMPVYLRTPGYYEYAVTIEVPPEADRLRQNNTVYDALYIAGEARVLLVYGDKEDRRDWQPLAKMLREADREVDEAPAFEVPRDTASLLPYDCVIFVNVPADAFDAVQLQAVRNSVFDQGTGLLMVGGSDSFGAGGYRGTPIEEALPVNMDVSQKKILPKGALAIILHTCEFAEGNTWAKRITKQAIKVLGSRDEVGVLDFEGREQWVFPLQPAADYDKLSTLVNAASPGDMPTFSTAMELGLTGLKGSDAAAKHMIIISDGDPSPPPPALVQSFIDSKVSVSMVAVFPHGGNDISVMRAVAESTGGRYYFPDDPNQLPGIFIKESKTLRRTLLQNERFVPEVSAPSPILKGLDRLPALGGYVLTTAKDRATIILKTPPLPEDPSQVDPVLATWRFGLGASAAFTSDFSRNWGAEWQSWEHYNAFVKQLLIDISRERKEGQLRVSTHQSGSDGIIVVEDFHPQESFLEVQARVAGPRDRSENVTLRQVAPRRYQGRLPLWGTGRYQVMAVGAAGGRTDRAQGSITVSYSPEYLRFRSDPEVLKEIAGRTGGRILEASADSKTVFETDRQPKRSSRPVFDWILMAIAILIPLDVACRRIQWDWAALRSALRWRRKAAETTPVLGTLLERKRAVVSEIQARREEQPLRPPTSGFPPSRNLPPAAPPATPTAPPKSPAAPPAASKPPEESTTTSRLRELKKRRQQGEDKTPE